MLTKEKILANKARREAIQKRHDEKMAPIRAHNAAVAKVQLKAMQSHMNVILKANGIAPMNCI